MCARQGDIIHLSCPGQGEEPGTAINLSGKLTFFQHTTLTKSSVCSRAFDTETALSVEAVSF